MDIPLIERKAGHLPGEVSLTSSSGRIKILTLGESFVGKSTLIKAYCEGKFISDYIPTIGIDYGVRTTKIEELDVKINFWDVAGDPVYFEVRNEFYRETHGVMLVFDLSSRKSFENLNQWLIEINKYINNKNIVIHLIGNKLDKEPRIISKEEATVFALNNNFKYTEVSSKDIDAVNKLFEDLFLDVIDNYKNQENEEQTEKTQQAPQGSQSNLQSKSQFDSQPVNGEKIQSRKPSTVAPLNDTRIQSRKPSTIAPLNDIRTQSRKPSTVAPINDIAALNEKQLSNINEATTPDYSKDMNIEEVNNENNITENNTIEAETVSTELNE